MINLDEISHNLKLDKNGFWVSDRTKAVSYPSEGSELYAEIEENSFWFEHRNKVIVAAARNFSPNGTIFDVGGGNGFVAKGLLKAGFECVLIEPSESGARKALDRGVKQVVCATTETAGFRPNSVPNIGLFDVVEHIENDFEFLKHLHSLIVKGGKVYLTVPAYSWLWSHEDVYAGHFRRYTQKSLSQVLRRVGFEIKYATYFFRFLPPAIFLLRTIPAFFNRRNVSSPPETTKKRHEPQAGLAGAAFNKILNGEINLIEQKKRISFGGSCLIVAQS